MKSLIIGVISFILGLTIAGSLGFTTLLVVVPVIFILSISYFSDNNQLNSLLPLISPLLAVGACAHLLKCVLTELNTKLASNT